MCKTAHDRALWASLTDLERAIVRDVMAAHPRLTLATAIKALREAGM